MTWKKSFGVFALCTSLALSGCNSETAKPTSNNSSTSNNGSTSKAPAKFSLAWSEYPSWSIFGVADEVGLIDGAEGKLGSIEKKHNVDIVLKLAGYDECITMYGNSQIDAVCITNIDILGAAGSRKSTAIMPTSTSNGADACIVAGIDSVDALAGKMTRGLEKSVSQFCFDRCLEKLGKKPADFPFSQMDPGAAAQSFQQKTDGIQSIMVWNPFVMESLRKRADAKVLFDSTSIPEEIIDMIVMGEDSLKKPGGKEFATALMETFYAMNKRMNDPQTMDKTLIGIGARFANVELEDMKTVVKQTRFYGDPEQAIALFSNEKFQKETMPTVSGFCQKYGMTQKPADISYGTGTGMLDFNVELLKNYTTTTKSN